MDIKRMLTELFDNFVGHKFDLYKEEVCKRNYNKFLSFSLYGAAITFVMLCAIQFVNERLLYSPVFLIIFAYFGILIGVSRILKNHKEKMTPACYIAQIPLMLIAIFMGTVMDPGEISVTIIVFICVLPTLILDKLWRVSLFIMAVSLTFIIFAYHIKPEVIFKKDVLDIVFFDLVGLSINAFSIKERINNVENYLNLRKKSEQDSLTMIYNRGTGERKIDTLIKQKQYGMFCIMDIDNFKSINDNFSHGAGDHVLKEISEKIKKTFRSEDIIFRLGGDEFAAFAVGITKEEQGRACIERLFEAIAAINLPAPEKRKVSISLGATLYCFGDQRNFEKIYKDSDTALYKAKEAGKCRYFFENE